MTASPLRTTDVAALVAALEGARVIGALPPATSGVAHDSRAVRAGTTFVALRGERVDGHDFLADAVAAGATVAVVDEAYARAHAAPEGVALVIVPDTRRALSQIAAAYYAFPARALRVTGVTGTNGKTTATYLIAALCEAGGIATGRIGTLGAAFGGETWPLDNTTPLSLELQGLLAEMRDRGAQAVAMEVSSHALALDRVRDVRFDAGVLTNVTRDHLDFHETFEAYAAAKRSLFDRARIGVFCGDDPLGARWAAEFARAGRSTITYGLGEGVAVRASDVTLRADGSSFAVDGTPFQVRLPGRFNVRNALAALCVARIYGIGDAVAARALAAFERVPGRMEHFAGGGIDVVVDYAHTPDALESVLRAARETSRGGLAVVFGCGGDRDRGKRPEMGRIASDLADRVVVTSDNPRGEAPHAIVAEILGGVVPGARVEVELDRRTAIRRAIAEAVPGDVVIVAGKGHEQYQIVGAATLPFDDREEVRAALDARAREARV